MLVNNIDIIFKNRVLRGLTFTSNACASKLVTLKAQRSLEMLIELFALH